MSVSNTNFISCAKWIKRGVAKSKPHVVRLTKEELKDLIELAKRDILGSVEELRGIKKVKAEKGSCHGKDQTSNEQKAGPEFEDDDEFNMQDYNNDEDIQSLLGITNLVSLDNIESHNSGEEEDEDDSEKEDEEIKPTDNLIAVGHVLEDTSILEVYIYNEESNDLYVHHDMVLPTIPLALETLSYDESTITFGNLLAIGGMEPEITIWNLDEVNSIEPFMKLGTFSKIMKHRDHGHKDAVLDLSWNAKLTHVLASGSVDRTVLLWDLNKARVATQFNFKDKVQTLEWHPSEENILLTGACDGVVKLLDCRLEETLNPLQVSGEVEKVVWHPINMFQALVGTSQGELCLADIRSEKFIWTFQAHSKELTGIAVHKDNPESIVTCSMDETLKTWSFSSKEPVLVNTEYANQKLQCLEMCPDNPNIMCIGGDGKQNSFKICNPLQDMEHEMEHNGTECAEPSSDAHE